MAEITTRASSFLPSIKCSQCSVEIPISHMGDHVCSPDNPQQHGGISTGTYTSSAVPPTIESRTRLLDGPFAPSTRPLMGPAPSSLGAGKTLPVRSNTLDTTAYGGSIPGSAFTNAIPSDEMPPPPRPPFSSNGVKTESGRSSPTPSLSGRKSPHMKILRSATAPLTSRSPSPDAMPLPQDSAFPVFPTTRSRSNTPTTPHNTSFGFQVENREMATPRRPSESQGSQVGPQPNKTKVASGAFNLKGMEVRQPSGADDYSLSGNHHDMTRSPSSSTTGSRARARSSASSNYTRNPSMSSIGGYTRLNLDESDVPAVPTVPSVALDYSGQKSNNKEDATNRYTTGVSPFDFGSFGQPHRSHTFPEDVKHETNSRRPSEPTKKSFDGDDPDSSRRPSDPSHKAHKSKPSVMLPLFDIGSTSSFKPSKSIRGRGNASLSIGQPNADPTKNSTSREDERLNNAPPVPLPSNLQMNDSDNPYHTPHESVSSNESYGSGVKSSSSRSSPPLNSPLNNTSPQRTKGTTSNDHFNDAFQGFQFGVESQSQPEQRVFHDETVPPTNIPVQRAAPSESQQPSIPTLSSPTRPVRTVKPAPAPLREIPPRQNISPLTSPENYLNSPISPFTDRARNIRVSPGIPPPPPIPESPPRRRAPISKGQCRGCNEAIFGKSISSADGQLTGRYHKQCFVCKTCQAPFQSIDFYVHNNNPYCARHYHEHNNSLCTKCDRGIEGQYLETDQRQKFHPYCISCQECHRILRDEFFEWNGRILCEQHAVGDAQRAAQQPSSLGPGRRHPERRTTKLMMM